MAVSYLRRTLNCGHLNLVQAGYGENRIGALATCDVCPLNTRIEGGRPVTQLRVIVNVEPVELPKHPDSWAPEWWH
jgi:hypothetical protein